MTKIEKKLQEAFNNNARVCDLVPLINELQTHLNLAVSALEIIYETIPADFIKQTLSEIKEIKI